MITAVDVGIFERHLDFRPLRGRRRGLLRCIFHRPDRRGSLSVDLDRGLFNCFACGAQGGLRRFAALVGEKIWINPGPISRARPELEDSRHGVAMWPLSDRVRHCRRIATSLRDRATRLGADAPATWPLLSHAARLERDGHVAEAALAAVLAEGRLP